MLDSPDPHARPQTLSGVMLDRSFLGVHTGLLEQAFRAQGVEVMTCEAVLCNGHAPGACGVRIDTLPERWALVSSANHALSHALRCARGDDFEWIRAPVHASIHALMAGPVTVEPWKAAQEVIALAGGHPVNAHVGAQEWLHQERRSGFKIECLGRVPVTPRHWGERAPVRLRPWHDFDVEMRMFFMDGGCIGYGPAVTRGSTLEAIEDAVSMVRQTRRTSRWMVGEALDQAGLFVGAWPRSIALPGAFAVDVGYDIKQDRFRLLAIRDPLGILPWPRGYAGPGQAGELPMLDRYACMVMRRWSDLMEDRKEAVSAA
jgi:hypothetical protein